MPIHGYGGLIPMGTKALGMGHERNGVSETEREPSQNMTGGEARTGGVPLGDLAAAAKSAALDSMARQIVSLRSALREWHEFQCGTGLTGFTWEQCESCQSMITERV